MFDKSHLLLYAGLFLLVFFGLVAVLALSMRKRLAEAEAWQHDVAGRLFRIESAVVPMAAAAAQPGTVPQAVAPPPPPAPKTPTGGLSISTWLMVALIAAGAIIAIVLIVSGGGSPSPGSGKPHQASHETAKAAEVAPMSGAASAPAVNCSVCRVTVASGKQPEYAKLPSGENGWRFASCEGPDGCESGCRVVCDDSSTPPQDGCHCQ